MKYCSKCGKETDDLALFCSNCGASLTDTAQPERTDAYSAGFAVLGFFIPIVGLIIYLVLNESQPKTAHSAGKGALIGFCVSLAIGIVSAIAASGFLIGLLNSLK